MNNIIETSFGPTAKKQLNYQYQYFKELGVLRIENTYTCKGELLNWMNDHVHLRGKQLLLPVFLHNCRQLH